MKEKEQRMANLGKLGKEVLNSTYEFYSKFEHRCVISKATN
jgi:hypothetical protein